MEKDNEKYAKSSFEEEIIHQKTVTHTEFIGSVTVFLLSILLILNMIDIMPTVFQLFHCPVLTLAT